MEKNHDKSSEIAQKNQNAVDINNVIQGFDNLLNLTKGVVDLVKVEKEAQLEITRIERDMMKFTKELENDQSKLDKIIIEREKLHKRIDELLIEANKISQRPERTEIDFKFAQMYFSLANTCLLELGNLH